MYKPEKELKVSSKQTELVVFGPYPLPCEKQSMGTSKQITKENVKLFWDAKDGKTVSMKQGCYIFALKAGRGFTPWYVGQATKTFKQEALHPAKLNHYNEVMFKGNKGTPVMFFVARPGNLNKIPKGRIGDLETFLIQNAYYKNPALKNKQQANDPSWNIRGVLRGGKGRATPNAIQFKLMLKL